VVGAPSAFGDARCASSSRKAKIRRHARDVRVLYTCVYRISDLDTEAWNDSIFDFDRLAATPSSVRARRRSARVDAIRLKPLAVTSESSGMLKKYTLTCKRERKRWLRVRI